MHTVGADMATTVNGTEPSFSYTDPSGAAADVFQHAHEVRESLQHQLAILEKRRDVTQSQIHETIAHINRLSEAHNALNPDQPSMEPDYPRGQAGQTLAEWIVVTAIILFAAVGTLALLGAVT